MIRKTLLAILAANTVVSHGSEVSSNRIVTAVTQDDNYAYLATHDGLILYDGQNELHLSEVIHNLPKSWASDVVYDEAKTRLIASFNGEGIWNVDLNKMIAHKISSTWTKEMESYSEGWTLVVGHTSLFSLSPENVLKKFTLSERILDVSGNSDAGYVLTEGGLYKVNKDHLIVLDRFAISVGSVTATPYGVSYFADETLVSYSINNGTSTTKLVGNGSALAFAPPHNLYFLQNGRIKSTTLSLDMIKQTYNQESQPYHDLYADDSQNVWAFNVPGIDVWSQDEASTDLPFTSKYNVIGAVDNSTWIGSKTGVYEQVGRSIRPLEWINSYLPKGATITNILQKESGVVISTSRGAYLINLESKSVEKVFEGYVINASLIDGQLYLATDKNGIITLDQNWQQKEAEFNGRLPSKEILAIRKVGDELFAATGKGLWNISAEKLFLEDVKISDVAVMNGDLYASSYGEGLYKSHENQAWERIAAPDFITSLYAINDELIVSTNNGIYELKNDDSIAALPRTVGSQFIPNSINVTENFIKVISARGIYTQQKKNSTKVDLKVSYVLTEEDVFLNPSDVVVNLAKTDWLSLAITKKRMQPINSKLNFRYRFGDGIWHYTKSPIVHIAGLSQGTKQLEIQTKSGEGWSTSQSMKISIVGPWYTSSWFYSMLICALLASLFVASFKLYKWIESFHRIFKIATSENSKNEAQRALQLLSDAYHLCSGNEIEVTEGLVKMNDAIDVLIPIAHSNANLGDKKLIDGLTIFQASCSANNVNTELTFDVTLGKEALRKHIERDIYTVVYYSVNAALQENCNKLAVYVNKIQDSVSVTIAGDSPNLSNTNRTAELEMSDYIVKRIAKRYGTKAKRAKGKFELVIPTDNMEVKELHLVS